VRTKLKILLLVLITVIVVCGVGAAKVFGLRAFIGPRARPLTNRKFERTPARLQRGDYLVNAMLACGHCHSPHDWSKHDAPTLAGMDAAGSVMDFADMPGRVVAPNLTADVETGAGGWSDDMLARSIREGIGHDGRALFLMPYKIFSKLSDEDVASIVVYLRSLPPVRNQLPTTELISPVKYIVRNGPEPITNPVPEPDLSTPLNRGKYLVGVIGCGGCHTPSDSHHNAIETARFGGGEIFEGPWGRVASANLTPDASGIPYYDQATFIHAIHTGYVGARALNPVMPWWAFRGMTDDDLAAIFTYLKSLPPVRHTVDNSLPSTMCPIDGAMHGGGDRNRKQ
jgi:cytochrome c553/mono/diheme cytochrome c family protein